MTLILGYHLYKSSVVAEMCDRDHNTVRKEGGVLCPFRGELGRSRSTSVPSGVFIHPADWLQKTWAKIGWGWVCFSEASWVTIEHSRLGRDLPQHQVAS